MSIGAGQPGEAPELLPVLRGPSRLGLTSRGLSWKGYVIEEHSVQPGELPEGSSSHLVISMWRGVSGSGEHALENGKFIPYTRYPGMFCLFPAGRVPPVRLFTHSHFLLCAVDPSLVKKVEAEMEPGLTENLRLNGGFRDTGLRQLLLLLAAEAVQGGPLGNLYSDHLIQALVTRILTQGRIEKKTSRFEAAAFPRRTAQRLIERMHELSADLDLATLAAETGFSQRHFVRMFRSSTGTTPHRFLTHLRLVRAKKLLRDRRSSLIDIAAACGFSSHAHMSAVFKRVLGVTPSEYRNQI